MKRLTRGVVLIVMALSITFGTGCGKKRVTESPVSATAPKLPGTDEVKAALDKNDYDGAMMGLLKAKAAVTTSDEQAQYAVLSRELKTKLMEASATDPKAAEALTALRQMTMGR
ncbi:MAG TPA: hypothetical protein VLU94_02880 [Candidatus Nitrosotalea sp.]|nr:hypothetical protein [Candidatus Nitrosotalea sp.]